MDMTYENEDQALIDILFNTDAPAKLARLAAMFVYHDNWQYDNHPDDPRGIVISPDFDGPVRIMLTMTTQHGL